MQKRGAVGIGVETIVVIIISVVILVGGVGLLYKFIGGATDIKAQLDERTDAELERLLVDQGKQVALPLHIADVTRGDSHVFGVGILNMNPNYRNFKINVEIDQVVGEDEQPIVFDKSTVEEWLKYDDQTIVIQENEHRKEGILVEVPQDAPKGTYIFGVRVTTENSATRNMNEPYGHVQQFYVNVK